ncbi:lysozyme [Dyadobacter jiangsuensis]
MLSIAVPFVAVEEGFRSVPYKDIGGVWTWCYGETEGQKPSGPVSKEQCDFLLRTKLRAIGIAVWYLVDTPMTNSRWAALTSFTYNVGLNAFRTSTLRRKLNAGHPQACQELMRWTFVKKTDCKIAANGCMGLPKRRMKEMSLCQS